MKTAYVLPVYLKMIRKIMGFSPPVLLTLLTILLILIVTVYPLSMKYKSKP